MTPEAQRIAIAEAVDFEKERNDPETGQCWTRISRRHRAAYSVYTFDRLPDYLNDLNAMHEAEKVLTDEQYETYRRRYNDVLVATLPEGEVMFGEHKTGIVMPVGRLRSYSATAAQRAEAFLKTLNLWTP